jgi:glycosyltransferase involved in cell wall biosynthesis
VRILHVPYTYFPDPGGGTEVYTEALCRALAEIGCEVVVAAPGNPGRSYTHNGVEVHRFRHQETERDLHELYGTGDPLAAREFAGLLRDLRPQLVHFQAFSPAISVRLLEGARQAGIATVFTYHSPAVSCQRGSLMLWGRETCDGRLEVRRCASCTLQGLGLPMPAARLVGALPPAFGSILAPRSGGAWTALRMPELVALRHTTLRQLLRLPDRIVAVCEWVRELLLRLGVEPQRLVLNRQGLTQAPSPAAVTARPGSAGPKLVFLGRVDRVKGLEVLLRAMALRPQLPLSLDVYGIFGSSETPYDRRVRELAAGDSRVQLREPVRPEEVVGVIAQYDWLVVPSLWLETGPLVVLEAAAAGVPVLGTRLGGIAELVRDGVDGLLVDDGQVPTWAHALDAIARDRGLLPRLRAGIRPPRGMDTAAREMLAVYRDVLGSSRT